MKTIRLILAFVVLLIALHSWVEAADTTPPTIGAVTAGACCIGIAFTDNEALNLQASTVVVRDGGTGEDITSKFTRTGEGDGTTAGSITLCPKCNPVGSYVIEICVYDKAGNHNCQFRAVALTTCDPPSCARVDPVSGLPGQTLDVTITGADTNFNETSVVSFSCPGITVNSLTVKSFIEIVANITIDNNAELYCNSDVSVTEEPGDPPCPITCSQAFEIASPFPPSCVSVSPTSLQVGETTNVTITLENIDLTGATGISVSFGCTGVTVNSTTVVSATEIVANISVAAGAPCSTCDVRITGGALGDIALICSNAFFCPDPPCNITMNPSELRTGLLLGRFHTIAITGSFCEFDNSMTVTISDGVKVQSVKVNSPNQLTVIIWVPPAILGGKGEKTVTVGDTTATFAVKGPFGN